MIIFVSFLFFYIIIFKFLIKLMTDFLSYKNDEFLEK
jgi:hypothetical protein